MTDNTRNEWTTPTLIVLTRTRPEEAVLTSCKVGFEGSGSGPEVMASVPCYYYESESFCTICNSTVPS
jgi:hypothetical protein